MDILTQANFDQGMDLIVDVQFAILDAKYQVWTWLYNALVAHNNKKKSKYLYLCLTQFHRFVPFSMSTNGMMVREVNVLIRILDLKMSQNY